MTNKIISRLAMRSASPLRCAFLRCASTDGQHPWHSGRSLRRGRSSATITLTSQGGSSKFAMSGGDGAFVIDGLEPGSYTISVSAEGFAPFDPLAVQVVAGKTPSRTSRSRCPSTPKMSPSAIKA